MAAVPGVAMWDAAYDYVRLTSKAREDDTSTYFLYERAVRSIMAASEADGIGVERWAWQGYRGSSCANVAAGARPDGYILQASGWAAHDAREMGLPYDNVPRVDVAVTVWYETDCPGTIAHHALVSRRFSAGKGASGWKVTHIDGGEYGTTTYIGSRESDIFIRIYDKWRESERDEQYRYAIRYECEYKGDAAKEVWAAAHSTAPGREWLQGVVRETCRSRGVFLPDLGCASLAQAPQPRKVKTDQARRLAWLRNQVAPAIEKMLTAGLSRDMIAEELGLGRNEPRRKET